MAKGTGGKGRPNTGANRAGGSKARGAAARARVAEMRAQEAARKRRRTWFTWIGAGVIAAPHPGRRNSSWPR